MVMVEPDTSAHDPNVVSGSDDVAFVEAPPKASLRRSNTTPKKAEGFMGLLGSFRKPRQTSESQDRHRSRPHREEKSSKRQVETDREDYRPSRRDERKRRSVKAETDAEGFTTDAAPTETEDAEARRAERRAKRASRHGSDPKDREAREAQERRARRKEAEKARALEEEEAREEEERRREEKKARRAAREERRLKEEQEAKEAAAAERRERRRQREMEEANREAPPAPSRSRRHSHAPEKYYSQDEYAGEHRRHRSHRSGDESGKSRRRKSSAPNPAPPPDGDYQPRRNGRTSRNPSSANPVMMNTGKDKISSWVHSQITDPPEAPPIEPTVLDVVPPAGAANGQSLSSDEETRRQIRRRARRQSKYPNRPEPEINPKRSRPRDSRRIDDEGSGEGEKDRYGRTYDGRHAPPAPVSGGGSKKSSWFRKFTSR